MSDICVVHLVWRPLGIQSLRLFLDSYRQHPGGLAHRLVVAFNGFASEDELGEWHEALSGIEYEWFLLRPAMQDIPAYFEAARRFESEHLCFLNSHSRLLDPEWLAKMYEHVKRDDVGVVGATGSWQSPYSNALFVHGRPSAYTELLKDYYDPLRPVWRKPFELSEGLLADIHRQPPHRRLMSWLYYRGLVAPFYYLVNGVRYPLSDWVRHRRVEKASLRRFAADFELFPAYHVRTNAFMLRRDVMFGLATQEISTKDNAYRFESGKEGMTSQLLRKGLKTLVVGRAGRAYDKEEWHLSETLWQGQQRNLLVADNQTNDYTHGSPRRRIFLSRVAWGDKARPDLPRSQPCADAVGNWADVLS